MIVRHRIFLAIMLLGLAGNLSTVFARGSQGNADPPWNAEHIDHLPEEVRRAVIRLCGQTAERRSLLRDILRKFPTDKPAF
jgi:hypothetical protein